MKCKTGSCRSINLVEHQTADNPLDKPKFIRSVNLFTAVALCVGQIVGAGIFISPKGVLLTTGSVSLSLIVWGLCGVIAMGAALCYAELATMVKESGGSWAYIRCGFGGAPAFVSAILQFVLSSGMGAIMALVTAEYLLSPFLDSCSKPDYLMKILAVSLLLLIVYVNTSTHLVQCLLKAALVVKVLTMATVVVGGFYWIGVNGSDRIKNPFEGTSKNGWSVALSFYSGIFSYVGYGNIVNVTEEVKNYKRNIPLSVVLSLILVTTLYILVNISYYVVLGKETVLSSDVVVLDWSRTLFGNWGVPFSFLVSVSAFGAAIASMHCNARVICCLARQGHMIQMLALVDVRQSIPIVVFIFETALAIILVLTAESILAMVNMLSFTSTLSTMAVMMALVKLKIQKYKDDEERFRVPLILPIFMTLVHLYLAIVPLISNPSWQYLYGTLIALSFVVLYFPFVLLNRTIACFDKLTELVQRLLRVAILDKDV